MGALKFILARKLLKRDLDVLTDAPDSKNDTVMKFGSDRVVADKLTEGSGAEWTRSGESEVIQLTVRNPPRTEPAQRVVRLQRQSVDPGKPRTGEVKMPNQRRTPLEAWGEPVRAERPQRGQAWALLIKDDTGVHARFVRDLDELTPAIGDRLRGAKDATVSLEFTSSGAAADPLLGQVVRALQEKRNVLLYGPPGTGKTRLMRLVEEAFRDGLEVLEFDPDAGDSSAFFKHRTVAVTKQRHRNQVEFVTFHPSTSYEGFVVGLRPQVVGKVLSYEVRPGPMLELAVRSGQRDHAGLLLIDEINRGSAAEVFGELITLLERDKRLGADLLPSASTVGVRLAQVPEARPEGWSSDQPDFGPPVLDGGRLFLPDELYLVASMNSLDRSVAPLDSALRRRFRVVHLQPDLALVRATASKSAELVPAWASRDAFLLLARLAHDLLAAVNEQLAIRRGPDYRLGHSYVLAVVSDTSSGVGDLADVVAEEVLPQLEDLLKGQPEAFRQALGGADNEGLLFRTHEATPGDDAYASEGFWVEVLPFRELLDAPVLLRALRTMAGAAGVDHWTDASDDETDPPDPAQGGDASAGGAVPADAAT